jgi:histone acetyltransferase (RNA polymerase elongator complex component)
MQIVEFPWPRPPRPDHAIVPVFLPFRGCPSRCIYCSQIAQTGQTPRPIPETLQTAARHLAEAGERGRPSDLAFYGGTFTALPEEDLARCLAFAATMRESGRVRHVRCSTRPDAVYADVLGRLKESGCTVVELGVQSFDDRSLGASRRNYTGDVALAACAMVKEAGLALGVQLLPGMPGCPPETFLQDVTMALGAGCDMLRFYPCLVLEGTELARLWRQGAYRPWEMETCLDALADGLLAAMAANVPVIRMGVPPERDMLRDILAGPYHDALGARVRGRALLKACARHAAGRRIETLAAPDHCSGHFWGDGMELRGAWTELGLTRERVAFTDTHAIRMGIRRDDPL